MKNNYKNLSIDEFESIPRAKILQLVLMLLVFFTAHKSFGQGASCATATAITINGTCLNGTITDNSQDAPNISGCSAGTFQREGWYTFTVTGGTQNITITANANNRNLYLQLISSTASCSGLAQIACANADNANGTQTETINATLGDGIYYIKVVNAGTNNGTMTLNSLCVTAPPQNDICSGAIALTPATSCTPISGSTMGATDNNETGDCTAGTENAVWYRFTAVATSHTVTVDGAAGFDAVVGVISNCGSTTVPTGGACRDNTAADGIETLNLTGLTIGATYYIQVYDYNAVQMANGFTICVTYSASPTITSLSATNGCVGSSLTITGNNLSSASSVTIGGTAATITNNTATSITVTVGTGTTGNVIVTTPGGSVNSGTTFTINALPANPGNPTSNSPQCASPGVTLTRAGTPPAGVTWYWQTTTTGTSTANSGATYNVTTSGTYYIRAQNAAGCWSTGYGSLAVTVNTTPVSYTHLTGLGIADPIATNDTPEGRSQNRRVEFAITANEKMVQDAQKEVKN